MTRRLRVLVLTPFYLPGFAGGGPIRTLAAMVAAHHDRHDFAVLTSAYDWGASEPLPVPTDRWTSVGGARVRYLPQLGTLSTAAQVVRHVRRARPDVLYLNGLFPLAWSLTPALLARLGLARGARVVLAPRGELGAGALAIKSVKKAALLRAATLSGLFCGTTWHASTPTEAAEIDAVFPGARVVVRENETELPQRARHPRSVEMASAPLRVLFVSRLSEKKGLHVLLQALAHLQAPVLLDIAGGGDAAYERHCRELAATLPDRHQVTWLGSLPPSELGPVYATHDVLALPTAHENFGHVVPESLAHACPVLLPDTTPWTSVVAGGGGQIVRSRAPQDWAASLARLAAMPAHARLEARRRAADAYDAWAAQRPRLSVFELLDAP